jgi:putative ABC transport system permease protein
MIGWQYSLSELRRRRGRSLLSLFSIVVAVAAIVAVTSATATTRSAYQKVFETLSGRADLEIVARGGASFPQSDVEKAPALPQVRAAVPVLRRATVLSAHDKKAKLLAVSMLPQEPASTAGYVIQSGRMPTEAGEIAVDEMFAAGLKIAVGDTAELRTGLHKLPQQVVGVFRLESAASMQQGGVLLAPLEHLQQLFRARGQIDSLHIYLKNPAESAATIAALRPQLPTTLVVEPPVAQNALLEEMMMLTDFGLNIASALALTTAIFISLSAFLMSVGQRRRQLSIMRAVGATRGQVVAMISFEALLLGIGGAALGVPLGVFGGTLLVGAMGEMLQVSLPATPNFGWSLLIGAIAGPLICLVGAWYPARRASGVSPLEGMRPQVTLEPQRGHAKITLFGLAGVSLSTVLAVGSVRNGGPLWVAVFSILLMLIALVLLLPIALKPAVAVFAWPLRRLRAVEAEMSQRLVLRHNERSSLTIGVLFMAVSAGVAISGAAFNVTADVRGWYARTMTSDFLIRTMMPDMSGQDPASIPESLAQELAARPDVASVDGVSILRVDVAGRPGILAGRDFCRLRQAPLDVPGAESSELLAALGRGEAVVGSVLAERAGLKVGDRFQLSAGGRTHEVQVAALANEYLAGGMVLYLDRAIASQLYSIQGLDTLLVTAREGRSDALHVELQSFAAEHGLLLQSFQELRRLVDSMILGVTAGLWVLLTLGLLVGAFGVVNTLTMNVLEQTRELGMLRAIGMCRWQVVLTVLGQAALIGLVGVAAGECVGLSLSRTINLSMSTLFGRNIAFDAQPAFLGVLGALSLVIVLATALLPAMRAARVSPIHAMRNE